MKDRIDEVNYDSIAEQNAENSGHPETTTNGN